jgi:hypothetical protein
MLTAFGVTALAFMMIMYALERRHSGFVLAFCLPLRSGERLRIPLRGVAVRRGRSRLGACCVAPLWAPPRTRQLILA